MTTPYRNMTTLERLMAKIGATEGWLVRTPSFWLCFAETEEDAQMMLARYRERTSLPNLYLERISHAPSTPVSQESR